MGGLTALGLALPGLARLRVGHRPLPADRVEGAGQGRQREAVPDSIAQAVRPLHLLHPRPQASDLRMAGIPYSPGGRTDPEVAVGIPPEPPADQGPGAVRVRTERPSGGPAADPLGPTGPGCMEQSVLLAGRRRRQDPPRVPRGHGGRGDLLCPDGPVVRRAAGSRAADGTGTPYRFGRGGPGAAPC